MAFLSGFAPSAPILSLCDWSWRGGFQSRWIHGHARTAADLPHLFRVGFGFSTLQKQDPVKYVSLQNLKDQTPNLYKSEKEVVSQQLSQVVTPDISNTSSQETTKSDTTIVKKMEKVAIKNGDQPSDPGKRKEEHDSKEISSPTTKRARKKKN